MSDRGDYQGDMSQYRFTDTEIEGLLSGSPVSNSELAPLAGLLSALRSGGDDDLDDETVSRFVAAAVAATEPAAMPAPKARTRRRAWTGSLRRRATAIAVAATVVLGGTSGLALAADGAKPGDALYGVDRALESIGIGAGGDQERLAEVEALFDAGQVESGLEHAAELLGNDASNGTQATAALMEAANRVKDGGSTGSAATRESVSELLAYIADNLGHVDGRQVAEMAAEIGNRDATTSDTPGNSPAEPPGLSDEQPGPPDTVPANPPGLSDDKPGPPDTTPADPPGLTNQQPGPPDTVPANPPGLSDDKPGQSNTRPANPPGRSDTKPGSQKNSH
jgi:hypothetical protein